MSDENEVVDAEAGIAAPVVTDPPEVEAVLVDDVVADDPENDGWEDPAPAEVIDPDSAAAGAAAAEQDAPDAPRLPRGWLETRIEEILKGIAAGGIAVPDGQLLTPHFLAKKLAELDATKEPSTGAVSAVFDRWVKCGAAVMAEKPYRFDGFTHAATEQGIPALKAATKAAKKAAAAPAAPVDGPGDALAGG